jgi:hypothetical protein
VVACFGNLFLVICDDEYMRFNGPMGLTTVVYGLNGWIEVTTDGWDSRRMDSPRASPSPSSSPAFEMKIKEGYTFRT